MSNSENNLRYQVVRADGTVIAAFRDPEEAVAYTQMRNTASSYMGNCFVYDNVDTEVLWPCAPDNCRGCKYSCAPELFDGGCTLQRRGRAQA